MPAEEEIRKVRHLIAQIRGDIARLDAGQRAHGIVPDIPDIRVENLSGGNQQKLVFARELAGSDRQASSTRPRVVLADEPVEAVDVKTRAQIGLLLREVARAGGSVLVVSADVEFVAQVSDRVLITRDGRVDAELTSSRIPDAALRDPGVAEEFASRILAKS